MITIEPVDLEIVTGAGAWTALDKGIGMASSGWKDKSCPSRAAWVGWGIGTVLGGAQWATWKKLGPAGQAVLGPINGLIGTGLVSSYMDNCEKQKQK